MSNLRRLCALVAASTLAATGLTLSGSPAQAASTDPRPVSIGADWLQGQLKSGLLHNDQFDFDDYGLSVDAGLGLQAVGGYTSAVDDIRDAVASGIDNYIAGDSFGDTGSTYGGPVAK